MRRENLHTRNRPPSKIHVRPLLFSSTKCFAKIVGKMSIKNERLRRFLKIKHNATGFSAQTSCLDGRKNLFSLPGLA